MASCPCFVDGIEVELRHRLAVERGVECVEVHAPTRIVEVAQHTTPLLVGILAQTALLSCLTVAPNSDLRAGVPLVVVGFGGICGYRPRLLYPSAHHEVGHRREQAVLLLQQA